MPKISVNSYDFYNKIKDAYDIKYFDIDSFCEIIENILFDYGLEYDGYELNVNEYTIKIEVPANRYDLLSLETLAQALNIFKYGSKINYLELLPNIEHDFELHITKEVSSIRPYCITAVICDVEFTDKTLASFISLQDKLHQNIGRKRQLVAIGTHDFGKIKTPITYTALSKKNGFNFIPLNHTVSVNGEEMLKLLEHTYLQPYLHIIKDYDNFPVIMDGNSTICSIPPIINADFCKLQKDTKDILIEITGTDSHKMSIVFNVIAHFLYLLCGNKLKLKSSRVIYESEGQYDYLNKKYERDFVFPKFEQLTMTVKMDYIRKYLGIPDLCMKKCLAEYMPKMGLRGTKLNENEIRVDIPINRRDILDISDIAEDVAIAYGFNNISYEIEKAVKIQPMSSLISQSQKYISQAGWKECLGFGLVSSLDNYQKLKLVKPNIAHVTDCLDCYQLAPLSVKIGNPNSHEYEEIRISLIPGMLHSIYSNKANALPLKLFEIGDIVFQATNQQNNVKQNKYLSAIYVDSHKSGLEYVHGLLDYYLAQFGFVPKYSSEVEHHKGTIYWLEEFELPLFLPGRCVKILAEQNSNCRTTHLLGMMGIINPDVLLNYNIPFPTSLFELSLDAVNSMLDNRTNFLLF